MHSLSGTCVHIERTRAAQVAQAKAYADKMVDDGRLHASPNRPEFRQDSVMWVSARCAHAVPSNSAMRGDACGAHTLGQWRTAHPDTEPAYACAIILCSLPETDQGAEEEVKVEQGAAFAKCVELLRGLGHELDTSRVYMRSQHHQVPLDLSGRRQARLRA